MCLKESNNLDISFRLASPVLPAATDRRVLQEEQYHCGGILSLDPRRLSQPRVRRDCEEGISLFLLLTNYPHRQFVRVQYNKTIPQILIRWSLQHGFVHLMSSIHAFKSNILFRA